tara:strand:- start:595 stop:798 length:204 start_codon:yes stop_codon:yes gene_type:complete
MAQVIELNREFIKGVHAAKMEVAAGDIFDLDDALYMFRIDPADSEFQRGYHAGLLQVYRQQKASKHG